MRRSTGLVAFLGLLAWAACSSDPDVPIDVGTSGNKPGSDFLGGDNGLSGGAGDSNGQSCLGETHQAETIGLDIFVMLDISASMLESLPGGGLLLTPPTKWDAVRQSLEAFVKAPESAEIGVGLQYFPQIQEGVPYYCTSNAECGVASPCSSSHCVADFVARAPGAQAITFTAVTQDGICESNADCPGPGESCRSMRGACVFSGDAFAPVLALCNTTDECAGIPGTSCEELGVCVNSTPQDPTFCTPSIGCPAAAGACAQLPSSCVNNNICEAGYGTPAVSISSGPNRARAIIDSLESVVPDGPTPTGPALRGALDQARAWARQNPGRQVVTVLATDGFPTECTPREIPDIAQIAADANSGNNPLRTFVIGVFSAGDLGDNGKENLDTWARTGGTERAFVINTEGNVADEFLQALDEIRDTAASCVFQLDGQAALDFDRVNLRITEPSGTVSALANVGDVSACAGDQGWYYAFNGEGTPTQIEVCPSTCTRFRTAGVSAELEIGCATRIR